MTHTRHWARELLGVEPIDNGDGTESVTWSSETIRPVRCSRCFKDSTRVAFGKWLNGRPVEEPVCDNHAPDPSELGTIRLYDTWQHTRHAPRQYRVEGIR